MERRRKTKIVAIIVLLISIICTTVAFAVMSTTLTINGTGLMDPENWEVKFANLSSSITGAASITTAATIQNDTTIGDFVIKLTKPGDSATYTFDVVNDGSIDAKLITLTKGTPSVTGTAGASKTSDETIVSGNLTYSLTYTTGGAAVAQDDTLDAGETKNMTLTLSYNGNTLPVDDVAIGNLGITLVYEQN
jgi:hypothetical protein